MNRSDVPAKNFCFDLHLNSVLITPHRCIMTAPITDETCTTQITARIGVLATMLDVAASDPVLAAWSPDWTATQDLSIHSVSPIKNGPIVVDARTARLGSKTIFVRADIYEGRGLSDISDLCAAIDKGGETNSGLTLAAKGLITFIRLPRTGAKGVDTYNPNEWVGELKTRSSHIHNPEMLNDRLGVKLIDPQSGVVEIANSPYVANSIGTINGGVQAITMETAAESMFPGMVATDIQIHYMSQLKVGPARTRCSVIREASDHCIVQVDLIDHGSEDKLLSTATFTLQ